MWGLDILKKNGRRVGTLNSSYSETVLSDPRTVVLLGIPFHDVTMKEVLGRVDAIVRARQPSYFVTANLDFAKQTSEDVELQRILLEADLVLCDGTPLVWFSRVQGRPLRERVAGSDLVPQLARHAEERGYRLFFLGGTEESLELALERVRREYPKLKEVGGYAPPFAPLQEMDNKTIVQRVMEFRPDILLVSFGCPKQEKWIYMHYRRLGVPLSMGVGATVDFLAGKFLRAPKWVADAGMEWVVRLVQEPRRLGGRYWKDFWFLVKQSVREYAALRRRPKEGVGSKPAGVFPETKKTKSDIKIQYLIWSGELTAGGKHKLPAPHFQEPVILDLSGVTQVDSRGLGYLLRLVRRAWAAGKPCCLLTPSEKLAELLEVTRLWRVLPVVESMEEAMELIERELAHGPMRSVHGESADTLVMKMPPRLAVDTIEACGRAVRDEWERGTELKRLVLDLSDTRFMDSSGLGFLISTMRHVRKRAGAELELVNLSENIRNVIRIARLEGVLLGRAERK